MDWESNLAAMIKCTDANLRQHFQAFEDTTVDLTAVDEVPKRYYNIKQDNVATANLRETMTAEYQQQEQEHHTPSFGRVSSTFSARGPPTSAPLTSFTEEFQERIRRAAADRARDNQRVYPPGNHHHGTKDQGQDHVTDETKYFSTRPAYYQQMYSSPSYDITQMMEQVRLSLKLEVDARAAIVERQLSTLLQLCKATSEELDRLRVEVCANDRQLHTLDHVQSKIRQELTTQKDIGFHLQSMCGKDESWRMQTENQLLEIRQMVSALREQVNSTQAVAQEKLSRSELLIQFNAAIEPIKAQFQAHLQHQAQQIAEITRTTSSSSLLLDGITQKVNRGITEEITELRSELSAIKHHLAKMDIFKESTRSSQLFKEEQEGRMKEKQQQLDKKIYDLREGVGKELMTLTKDYVNAQIKPFRQLIDEGGSRSVIKQDLKHLQSVLEDSCQKRCTASVMQVDSWIKSAQDQLDNCKASIIDTSDRFEKFTQQSTSAMTTMIEDQAGICRNEQFKLVKMVEREQQERKQTMDDMYELLRKNRHQLEDQVHLLKQESQAILLQHNNLELRLQDSERHVKNTLAIRDETITKEVKKILEDNRVVEWELKLKSLEETVSNTSLSLAALSQFISSSATRSCNFSATDVGLVLEKQTKVYVSTLENLLQKMQMQLQSQAHLHAHTQTKMTPVPDFDEWTLSPYTASKAPSPLLHLLNSSVASNKLDQASSILEIAIPTTQLDHFDMEAVKSTNASLVNLAADTQKAASVLYDALIVKPDHLIPKNSRSLPASLTNLSLTSFRRISRSSSEKTVRADKVKTNKRENALLASLKGASIEAELAKARVENRRKRERETKQRISGSDALIKTQEITEVKVSSSKYADSVELGGRRLSVDTIGPLPVQTPVGRSHSSPALFENDGIVHPAVSDGEDKRRLAASIPSSPTASESMRLDPHLIALPKYLMESLNMEF